MSIRVAMELPSYKLDHYELDNGEEIHREYSDSFWIPEKEKRESLQVGDVVKLIFRMEEEKGSEDISVERMWVEITDVKLPYYKGNLDNDPSGSNCVFCGQSVVFNPCHIIDIHED